MKRHHEIATGCIAFTLFFLQITPLFWSRPFYVDWFNHVWIIEYYSSYLRQHGEFPTTLDVSQGFGNPLPLFYGIFLYPPLSILGLFIGADLAVRVACGALLLAPLISFTVIFQVALRNWPLATLLSVAVNSSTYQLTNLYSRSALTEFAAFQLLILAGSLAFYGITRRTKLGNAALSFGMACLTLSLGAHPITFYIFSLFALPLILFSFFPPRQTPLNSQIPRALLWTLCTFIVLLPWIVNTIECREYLQVTTTNVLAGKLHFFPKSIDSPWGKLGLFYIDPRVLFDGIDATSTPFLDAPFNLPLIIVLLAVYASSFPSERIAAFKTAYPALLCTAAIAYAAIPPTGAAEGFWPSSVFASSANGALYGLLTPIQFAYRLSGTFSLCMTLALLIAVSTSRRSSSTDKNASVLFVAYICASIALAATGQKLAETYSEFIKYPEYRLQSKASKSAAIDSDRILLMGQDIYAKMVHDLDNYPITFYGPRDFTMPRLFPATASYMGVQAIPSFRVREYGEPYPIQCQQSCTLLTNIVPSKFHRVLVDNAEPRNIMISSDGNLQFSVSAGKHIVVVKKTGDIVRFLAASVWAVILWLFFAFLWLLWLITMQTAPRIPMTKPSPK